MSCSQLLAHDHTQTTQNRMQPVANHGW